MSPRAQDLLGGAVKASWRRFLDTYEPLRPDLYRYCRHLTRSPWDAEDMAQEAMARAFVSLGMMAEPPQHPRAWLFRVASNLWINRTKRGREVPAAFGVDLAEPATDAAEPRATREAAGTLLAQLAPQERAAVVLKDAFGLSLEEIAEALATTPGAVKSALHRGRAKLVEPEPEDAAPVAPPVLDAFCDAFNARDLDRLTALLLDTTTLEYPGFKIEYGAEAVRAGSLAGTLFGCPEGDHAPVATPRCELRAHRGEAILLWWSGDEVHAVVRVDVEGDRIARLHNYYHAPEVVTEVCRELAVPYRTHGYRPEQVSA
jgi:RNA polymerase sigma-70 factor (ECF subfamily)